MKNLQNVRYAIATVAAVAAFAAFAPKADAQTQAFTSTVTVQNTLTLAKLHDLNFGTLIVARDSVTTSSIVLDPTAGLGVLGAITNGADSYIAVINAAAASPAEVSVSAGAPGANINVNIPAVSITAPTAGLNAFALSAWQYSWNGGPATPIVPGTAEVVVFDNTYAAGVNNLKVGATLASTAGATGYSDVAHTGAFNVVFSY